MKKISNRKSFVVNCANCNVAFNPWKTQPPKHGNWFCNKSCRMTYFNIHHHINKDCNRNFSFPENYLIDLIQLNFPDLDIVQSDRLTLKSGLELDIHIPSIKLAIEINGPVHYMPIYGSEKLALTQLKDNMKFTEAHLLGISLLVIDVSFLNGRKKQIQFMEEQFESVIQPLIKSLVRV